MAISVTCDCGKKLSVKDEMGGKKIFCCLSTTVVGAWWFFLRGPSLDSRVIGKWTPDIDKKTDPKNLNQIQLMIGGDIEFKSNGTVNDKSPLTPFLDGKWKTVSTKGDMVTVEVRQSIGGLSVSKLLEIKVVDADHLKITHPDTKQEFSFKRVT
jgi:hypothetical protein